MQLEKNENTKDRTKHFCFTFTKPEHSVIYCKDTKDTASHQSKNVRECIRALSAALSGESEKLHKLLFPFSFLASAVRFSG